MSKKIVMIVAAVLIALPVMGQHELQQVLDDVGRNNLTLRAEGYSVEGRSREARMGNSLEPLSVSYNSAWDAPQAAGKSGELEVSQEFDLPMLYATRSKIAKNLAEQYNTELLALRQQILLEAKEVYLELCALKEIAQLAQPRLQAAEHVAKLYAARYETGDATIIDKNRTEFEYLLLKESMSETDLRIIELTQRLIVLNGGEPVDYQYILPPAEVLMPLENLMFDWEEYAPDVTVSRLREEGARQDVKLSRRQALPKIELGYKHEYAPGEGFNGVVAGLSIPIFSNRHNVKRAKAFEQAARINTESVLVDKRNAVTESYRKVQYMESLLGSFGEMPSVKEYIMMLERTLEAGQMNIVDYYSELDTFYSTLETRLKAELQYQLGLARLNMIYL